MPLAACPASKSVLALATQRRCMPAPACLLLAKQALNYLHSKDVIHLDVKSQVRAIRG